MTPYEQELSKIGETVGSAATADIKKLKLAIVGASEASIIAVGSGGSFTVASLLCSLHEAFTGRVSRAVTPLELICNPTIASTSPIFIVSAEGKNPDILEALHRARQHSSRTVHVITNREQSPLMEQANRTLCAHFGLPLQYGGWQDVQIQTLVDWMESGLQPSRALRLEVSQ